VKPFPVAVAFLCAGAGIVLSQSATGNAKVDKLVGQMTLAEKISLIHGAPEDPATSQGQPGYVPGVPRLGIPPLRLVDGPPGVLTKIWSTGMTSTMGLAATFSREDARQNGVVIGGDARALGQDIVLEPFLNLTRDFRFARAYNTYGEDPLLTGRIGAAVVAGIQSKGVMSAAKHYTAFDGAASVNVDPQTLHEIYVTPFAEAVDAGIAAVLCSSNLINGRYSCGSGATLNTILKNELGFKGFVIPDFEGTHSTLYINEGLDLEMPGGVEGANTGRGGFFLANAKPAAAAPAAGRGGGNAGRGPAGGMPEERSLSPAAGRGPAASIPTELPIGMLRAIETGQVKESTINAAVGRILGQMDRFGYLDKPPSHVPAPEDLAFNTPVLLKTAEDSAVLLKNRDGALPLTSADLGSVAFIGPGAGQTVAIGLTGGKGPGIPASQMGTIAAIEKMAGRKVIFAVANDMTGTPVPASALRSAQLPDGPLDFTVANGRALPPGSSSTWSGTLTVPGDGSYMIALQVLGAAGAVTLDGQTILRTGTPGPGRAGAILHPNQDNLLPTTDGLDNVRNLFTLKAGPHEFAVTATGEHAGNPVQVRLAWVTPQQQQANHDAAIATAEQARKAVVFVWGRDRPESFHLPGDQDKLIADVAAVNPNTIVVLNTSLPVAMPWLDQVKSVVQMWWPGDQGGPATANVLLGRINPAGRLPFTWPRSLDEMVPSIRDAEGTTTYSEGIFMGYRWFDKKNLTPLFPFGHGLSYTTFAYSKPKIVPAPDGGFDVRFTLRNAGKTAGDEVPQVYLGPPAQAPEGAQFALKALAAFDRVHLKAGESKNVTLHMAPRRLQYWSASDAKWVTVTGSRPAYVAASSRDVRLQVEIDIPRLPAR
jgi:beta-glucosidase